LAVQAVLDHGADADEPHAVSEDSPQIAGGRNRHPDRGEAIVAQQVEDTEGAAPIGLRLADDHCVNLRGIADAQGVAAARHEGVKPEGVRRTPYADRHRPRPCDPLDRVPVVSQPVFAQLSRAGIQHGHLLLPGVQIAAPKRHAVGLLSESADVHVKGSHSAEGPFS
jgi:hypothetical protein